MFTIEQIKNAHSKVKSGADFPVYIQALKKLGVVHYETFVSDGHTDYFDIAKNRQSTEEKYSVLIISETANIEVFKNDLKAHQEGKTDYPTFCNNCAESGIEKWMVDLEKMTCTYFDGAKNEILTESIPG